MTIDLSIIIVSYNAKEFLSLCLLSVQQNLTEYKYEIIVVNNASIDGSVEWLNSHYPDVRLINNIDNLGFSKACNQGARTALGHFLLFLNPDTILPSDAISKIVSFGKEKGDSLGAFGTCLMDGAGNYLKESKRQIPGIANALSKLSGLYRLFSSDVRLGTYYDLAPIEETHHTDILSGAFMCIRREIFVDIGGFDEEYFMYGEDIDLSLRILQAGYINWYYSGLKVIHFKGESTRKTSAKYFRDFYASMAVYLRKHVTFRHEAYRWSTIVGIRVLGAFHRTGYHFRRILPAIADFLILFTCFWGGHEIWGRWHFGTALYYPFKSVALNFGIYSTVFLYFYWINGLYFSDRKSSFTVIKSWIQGLVATLVLYSLLPESLRFSRMSLLLGAGMFLVSWTGMKLIFQNLYGLGKDDQKPGRSTFVGTGAVPGELLTENGFQVINELSSKDLLKSGKEFVQPVVIFDMRSSDLGEVIRFVAREGPRHAYYFFSDDGPTLLSSRQSHDRGVVLDQWSHYKIRYRANRLQKRIFDLIFGCILLIPGTILSMVAGKQTLRNCLKIIRGYETVVSYMTNPDQSSRLPSIQKGYIHPALVLARNESDKEKYATTLHYAMHYTVLMDIFVSVMGIKTLLASLMKAK